MLTEFGVNGVFALPSSHRGHECDLLRPLEPTGITKERGDGTRSGRQGGGGRGLPGKQAGVENFGRGRHTPSARPWC